MGDKGDKTSPNIIRKCQCIPLRKMFFFVHNTAMLLALLQGFEASICNGDSNLFADLVSRILRFIKKNKEIRYALRFFCVKLREYCCVTLTIVKETIKVSVILLNHCSFSSST